MKLFSLCMDSQTLKSLSLDPIDAKLNAEQAIEEFKGKMKILFPNFMLSAKIKNIMSGESLVIDFANVADKDQAPNGIMHNVSGFFTIIMDVTNSGMHTKPITTFNMEMIRGGVSRRVQSYGVKQFRKISGTSPSECLSKLFKWFEKNAEALRSLPVSVY